MNLKDQLESCAMLLTLGSDRRRRLRSGIQTLEAVLAIPVLLIGMFAFFQFGPLVTVQQAVTQATIETAREISKVHMFDLSDSVDLAVAENVVNEVLGVHGIQVGDSGLLVILEDISGVECLGDALLEPTHCPASTSVTDASEYKVTLILRLENSPIPNVLGSYCVDLSDKYFQVTSVSRNHCVMPSTS